MLSNKIITMLNEQLNLELYSSNLYLQMSAWCTNKGYEGAAIFLREHATEEMVHMRKLFTYLNETGAYTTIAEIEAPKSEFSSLKEVLELTFEHEKLITKKINELVEITLAEKDFASFNFLQWYVSEQHEEETLFGGILDKLNLLGQDSKGLYYIDKELAKLVTA
ncbi:MULTISPECIES: non-heme ferritin [Pasteurellaceae]|uniref:Ferritin n=3 Tax=Pasteurellaceae TaxID=712 RepID=A0A1H7UZ23_9PAST|nr:MULTISPECIES: non-heme ferritin [Pasteurella]MDP8050921.1 non-heme ferritin [Pasteurella atlantica]MDP8078517.1 non-heme ferritin [Pasteurella skyensis]MDP8084391.1 non-heme ferritin [Pasteurella skyensis]MDP8098348.1 non-heme ferritin [Pasteurella atlantica]MDP8104191.1 non-heme ferritin [Pasteurella atlantica]